MRAARTGRSRQPSSITSPTSRRATASSALPGGTAEACFVAHQDGIEVAGVPWQNRHRWPCAGAARCARELRERHGNQRREDGDRARARVDCAVHGLVHQLDRALTWMRAAMRVVACLMLASLAACQADDGDCITFPGISVHSSDLAGDHVTALGGTQRFQAQHDPCEQDVPVDLVNARNESPGIASVRVVDGLLELEGLGAGLANVEVSSGTDRGPRRWASARSTTWRCRRARPASRACTTSARRSRRSRCSTSRASRSSIAASRSAVVSRSAMRGTSSRS